MGPSIEHRIRLVFSNGSVCDFTQVMSAGEALQSSLHTLADASHKSFNNFLVCDSASLRVGKRACPMHPETQLELGHLYYVLPIRTFQHRLAWSYISSLAAMAMSSSTCSMSSSAAAMSSSTTTPTSSMSSSATTTHVLVYNKSSPSKASRRCAMSRTFACILAAKFYLRFLLHHRLLSKGKCRVDDTHMASCRNGASSRLALGTEAGRAEGAGVLTSCRFNNICDSPEVNSKYVELLIDRSNSWKPPLLTIQES